MNFEEALCAELGTIVKTSPLYVLEGTIPPYLVYRKENVQFTKTFDGIQKPRRSASYNLLLFTKQYDEMQTKTELVIDKLLSFQSRAIGTDGPMIQDVTIELMGDVLEAETDCVRAEISLKVKY